MEWIVLKLFWTGCPGFADEFVWREATKGLHAPTVVVGIEEVRHVRFESLVGVVVVALDDRLLDGATHAFNLAVGPGMFELGEPVLDDVSAAAYVEHVGHVLGSRTIDVARRESELDAVFVQYGVDFIGDRLDHVHQEGGCGGPAGRRDQRHHGELAKTIDGDIEVELAFSSLSLSDIDADVANWMSLERPPVWLVTCDVGQAGDVVALQTTKQ